MNPLGPSHHQAHWRATRTSHAHHTLARQLDARRGAHSALLPLLRRHGSDFDRVQAVGLQEALERTVDQPMSLERLHANKATVTTRTSTWRPSADNARPSEVGAGGGDGEGGGGPEGRCEIGVPMGAAS